MSDHKSSREDQPWRFCCDQLFRQLENFLSGKSDTAGGWGERRGEKKGQKKEKRHFKKKTLISHTQSCDKEILGSSGTHVADSYRDQHRKCKQIA